MPGQFESFQRLMGRSNSLADELGQTADPAERKRLYERRKQLRAELSEWADQTKRAAEAGDYEAKTMIEWFNDLRGDDEGT